jgi:hypothetical protein
MSEITVHDMRPGELFIDVVPCTLIAVYRDEDDGGLITVIFWDWEDGEIYDFKVIRGSVFSPYYQRLMACDDVR